MRRDFLCDFSASSASPRLEAKLINMELAVSTIAFKGQSPEEILRIGKEEGLFLEFSTGFPPESDPIAHYRSYPHRKMPHNYFPPPEDPFVLNLASADEGVRKRSIEHCKQGLRLTAEADGPFFAAHAGFCLDPKPEELGEPFDIPADIPREEYMDRFLDSIQKILTTAKQEGIPFLIENNVLAPFNLPEDGTNPLLCCDPKELLRVREAIGEEEHFGLLLDTAHFKVSAHTLDFPLNEVNSLKPFIKGVHHSDNDGKADSNEKLSPDYWFLPYLHTFKELVHVLEVEGISLEEVREELELLRTHADA